MVGLGQTSNPAELIPGDAGAITKVMIQLYDYGVLLTEAGNGLSRIDTSAGWTGPAAEAFRQRFTQQPAKWQEAGSCFVTAARALEGYIPMLIWAQKAAGVAIQMWAHGNKKAARATLARAQSQLAAAASNANAVIGAARDKAPPHPGFWSDIGHFLSGLGHDFVGGVEGAAKVMASLGNSVIQDPGTDLGVVGGIALTGISGGGEVLGLAANATGVGAPVGTPLTVASAAGITAGTGMTLASAAKLGSDAAGSDQVDPFDGGGTSDGEKRVPQRAQHALGQIDQGEWPPRGIKGGGSFDNDGRGGGEVLPGTDASGKPITYQEWDVNPRGPGGRDAIRIVTGSDGSAYYTDDHYKTFTRMR